MAITITRPEDLDMDTYVFDMPFPKGLKWKATFTEMEEIPAFEFDMVIADLSDHSVDPYMGTLTEALRTMARAAAGMIIDFTSRTGTRDVVITCVSDDSYGQLFTQFISPLNRFLGREFQVFALNCSKSFRAAVAPPYLGQLRRLFVIRRRFGSERNGLPAQIAHPIVFFEEDEKSFFHEKEVNATDETF